ncbi:transposase [Plakobranchus ocellatus]|uniref:Transposase n=1 Tax=Plakobranchus ocellatus TaxID=259542 RepID=A0AAV4CBG7_9GAST|nr:transposase [Plakobranchus ocellatus]
MATSNDLLIKLHSVIEFLAAEGCSAANIHARMKTVNGEMCISDCAVRKWVRIFTGENPKETILRDRKRAVCLSACEAPLGLGGPELSRVAHVEQELGGADLYCAASPWRNSQVPVDPGPGIA